MTRSRVGWVELPPSLARMTKASPSFSLIFSFERSFTAPGFKNTKAPIMSGDHGVLDQRVARRDELDANRAGVHPGSRGELEILGDAAVEHQPLLRDGWI